MSGDVQPRKRKDKKRKKDDSADPLPSQPQVIPTPIISEDLNIHVHKEEGTGGGICAKIVFFLLFSALAVLIGLIITEHRGLTDLDAVDQDSRFSQIFEGWIDNSASHDDHDDHLVNSLEEDDHDDVSEHGSEEAHNEEEDEHDEEQAEASNEDDEEEEATDEADDDDNEDNTAEDDDQNLDSEEAENESEVLEDDDEEEDNIDEDEEETSRYVDNSAEQDEENANDDDENSAEQDEENADDDDEEEEEDNILSKEAASEEDNLADKSEEERQDQDEEQAQEEEAIPEKEEEPTDAPEDNTSNTNMVVKIGVGVALLVVAHVVLVRKWKSASPTPVQKEPTPDLSRRNTIVVPPTYQEVERDIADVEEGNSEYSDEDGEVESDDDRVVAKSAKSKYQELRTTYERSLTPESEPEYQNKPAEGDEDDYEEEDEEDLEEEELEEEEEEDEDEDLLQRLEAKYGILQGRSKEIDKQDDYDDEQFSSWKRVNVRDDNEPVESDSDKQSDPEPYEYESITNKQDSRIKTQIDEAQNAIGDE